MRAESEISVACSSPNFYTDWVLNMEHMQRAIEPEYQQHWVKDLCLEVRINVVGLQYIQ